MFPGMGSGAAYGAEGRSASVDSRRRTVTAPRADAKRFRGAINPKGAAQNLSPPEFLNEMYAAPCSSAVMQ